jgi:hypothetical protein
MSTKGTLMAVLVAGALIALVLSTPDSTQGESLAVTDVQVTPDPPIVGEKAVISCHITDETDVKYVWLFYCSPLACLPAIDMSRGTDGLWSASTSELDTAGAYHFNITVEYDNGTRAWTEDHSFSPVEAPSTELGVVSLAREPQTVKADDGVDVYCLPEDPANVTSMQVMYTVDGAAKAPVDMTKLANGTYHATIGPFSKDSQVAYNVTATLASGSKAWTADITFKTEKKASDGDDDGFIPALGAAATIAVLMGLAVSVRGRRRSSK